MAHTDARTDEPQAPDDWQATLRARVLDIAGDLFDQGVPQLLWHAAHELTNLEATVQTLLPPEDEAIPLRNRIREETGIVALGAVLGSMGTWLIDEAGPRNKPLNCDEAEGELRGLV